MIEAVGITLRESIEAILVIFIMVAYLDRTNRAEKKKAVYAGAALAVILSIILAITLTVLDLESENELFEGVMFFIAGILVASLAVWMWSKAKVIKQEIEKRVATATSSFTLALIAFIMVFREGIETVIFLQSLLLSGSSPVENFLGGIIGIALSVILGIIFMKGTARINLSRFFKVTSAILAVLVVKLIANGFHELFEVELLPSNQTILTVVGYLARSSTGSLIIGLMLIAIMIMVIYDIARAPAPDLTNLRPAERRKVRYKLTREKYSKIVLSVLLLVAVLVILTPNVFASGAVFPEPVKVDALEDNYR